MRGGLPQLPIQRKANRRKSALPLRDADVVSMLFSPLPNPPDTRDSLDSLASLTPESLPQEETTLPADREFDALAAWQQQTQQVLSNTELFERYRTKNQLYQKARDFLEGKRERLLHKSTCQQVQLQEEVANWLRNRRKFVKRNIDEEVIEHARAMFEMLDEDGSESVELSELQNALKDLGIHISIEKLQERVSPLEMDSQGGQLSFAEFLQGYVNTSTWDSLYNQLAKEKYFQSQRPPSPKQELSENLKVRYDSSLSDKFRTGLASHRNAALFVRKSSSSPQRSLLSPQGRSKRIRGSPGGHKSRWLQRSKASPRKQAILPAMHRTHSKDPAPSNTPRTPRRRMSSPSSTESKGIRRQLDVTVLPFFLWVPAYYRLRLIRDIMGEGPQPQRQSNLAPGDPRHNRLGSPSLHASSTKSDPFLNKSLAKYSLADLWQRTQLLVHEKNS